MNWMNQQINITIKSIMSLKNFIKSQLGCVLAPRYISILTDNESLKMYSQAFTAPSLNPLVNYEYLEQMGDVSANKFLVYYFYKRFPKLLCPLGVKVVARLKINYGSKQCFSSIAERLGFEPFILVTPDDMAHNRRDLLEDVFESFIGVTELILDTRVHVGVGAVAITQYLTAVFDQLDISLNYDDLYDAKTRLKEIIDRHGRELGKIKYAERKNMSSGITESTIRLIKSQRIIGQGLGASKSIAQQTGAEIAIGYLRNQGYTKEIPPEYYVFSQCPNQKKKNI